MYQACCCRLFAKFRKQWKCMVNLNYYSSLQLNNLVIVFPSIKYILQVEKLDKILTWLNFTIICILLWLHRKILNSKTVRKNIYYVLHQQTIFFLLVGKLQIILRTIKGFLLDIQHSHNSTTWIMDNLKLSIETEACELKINK